MPFNVSAKDGDGEVSLVTLTDFPEILEFKERRGVPCMAENEGDPLVFPTPEAAGKAAGLLENHAVNLNAMGKPWNVFTVVEAK